MVKQTDNVPVIHVFGDSHSIYFHPTRFYAARHRIDTPLSHRVKGRVIAASSVAGFRPGKTTLGVKEVIIRNLPTASRMIIAFGQVDLELGYYYRLSVKGEEVRPDSYVEWLTGVYEAFLEGLIVDTCELAIKGVNLTALAPKKFSARYVARIVGKDSKVDAKDVAKHILSEDDQNDMHLKFNGKLREIASRMNLKYFDLNDQLTSSEGETRLADQYKTAKFDHHLADTVEVRRMHYDAVNRVFGLS